MSKGEKTRQRIVAEVEADTIGDFTLYAIAASDEAGHREDQ
jgi:hypothetical protein